MMARAPTSNPAAETPPDSNQHIYVELTDEELERQQQAHAAQN
tara:strand:+ start:61670 stop:61798 length:129 start_codon:yes stop_codon:yes gene_type:complete